MSLHLTEDRKDELINMLDNDPSVEELESVTDEIIQETVEEDGEEKVVYTAKNHETESTSFGDTKEDAMRNMAEALVLKLKVMKQSH